MYLNGDEVKVGDKLYHLTLQSYGTVETVLHGTARVNMCHTEGVALLTWAKMVWLQDKNYFIGANRLLLNQRNTNKPY